jgi:hypothetical protein
MNKKKQKEFTLFQLHLFYEKSFEKSFEKIEMYFVESAGRLAACRIIWKPWLIQR